MFGADVPGRNHLGCQLFGVDDIESCSLHLLGIICGCLQFRAEEHAGDFANEFMLHRSGPCGHHQHSAGFEGLRGFAEIRRLVKKML